ncbi:MAG: hypothetical protein MK119_03430 [Kordia sp.]|nr:hypothetical protein [Kordia sp.]
MKEKIMKLVSALHAEGKYILLGETGGYKGCREENKIETIYLNTIKITCLNFCYGCNDNHYDEEFIEIFNSTMYQLLEIKSPDYTTHLFYGTFKGKGENRSKIELTMTHERTFTLTIQKKNALEFCEGIWENANDTLILTSKKITHVEDRDSTLSKGNWVQLDNVNFQLKYRFRKSKLIKLGAEKWKLKKVL